MPEFDPYYIWLGIPREEQPPDHYRLLGIRRFETNPDVIANAAEQRAAHVRSMQAGMRQGDSQALLNQIFLAARVLLDQQKKAHYDNELALRQNRVAPQVQTAQPPVSAYTSAGITASPSVPIPARPVPLQAVPVVVGSREDRSTPRRVPQRGSALPIPGWLLGLAMAVICFAALYFSGVLNVGESEGRVAERPEKKQQPRKVGSRGDKPSAPATERNPVANPPAAPASPPAKQPETQPQKEPEKQPKESPGDKSPSPPASATVATTEPDRDEILEALRGAKEAREASLKDAEARLLQAFDDNIVAAAKAKEANVVELLVAQKESFVESGEPPKVAQIKDAFEEYITSRKQLDSDLNRAYKDASLAYAERLMTNESKAIAEEGREFVADEIAELERLTNTEKPVVKKGEDDSTSPLNTSLAVTLFLEAYEKEIESANSQETSARFEQVMKDMPAKMDAILKRMSWTIHCPIVEVREGSSAGFYAIHFEAPPEFSSLQIGSSGQGQWEMRSVVNMRLKKEQALSIEPGQVLVITATPRFPVKRTAGEDYVFLQRTFFGGRERNYFQHFLEFQKVKMEIRPRSEPVRGDPEDGGNETDEFGARGKRTAIAPEELRSFLEEAGEESIRIRVKRMPVTGAMRYTAKPGADAVVLTVSNTPIGQLTIRVPKAEGEAVRSAGQRVDFDLAKPYVEVTWSGLEIQDVRVDGKNVPLAK